MKNLILVVCFSWLPAGEVLALKCNTKIISIGDRIHRIHRLCGEPTYTDFYDKPITNLGFANAFTHVDVWTYNFGPQRFMQELVFEDGILRYINRLEYGF